MLQCDKRCHWCRKDGICARTKQEEALCSEGLVVPVYLQGIYDVSVFKEDGKYVFYADFPGSTKRREYTENFANNLPRGFTIFDVFRNDMDDDIRIKSRGLYGE